MENRTKHRSHTQTRLIEAQQQMATWCFENESDWLHASKCYRAIKKERKSAHADIPRILDNKWSCLNDVPPTVWVEILIATYRFSRRAACKIVDRLGTSAAICKYVALDSDRKIPKGFTYGELCKAIRAGMEKSEVSSSESESEPTPMLPKQRADFHQHQRALLDAGPYNLHRHSHRHLALGDGNPYADQHTDRATNPMGLKQQSFTPPPRPKKLSRQFSTMNGADYNLKLPQQESEKRRLKRTRTPLDPEDMSSPSVSKSADPPPKKNKRAEGSRTKTGRPGSSTNADDDDAPASDKEPTIESLSDKDLQIVPKRKNNRAAAKKGGAASKPEPPKSAEKDTKKKNKK